MRILSVVPTDQGAHAGQHMLFQALPGSRRHCCRAGARPALCHARTCPPPMTNTVSSRPSYSGLLSSSMAESREEEMMAPCLAASAQQASKGSTG